MDSVEHLSHVETLTNDMKFFTKEPLRLFMTLVKANEKYAQT